MTDAVHRGGQMHRHNEGVEVPSQRKRKPNSRMSVACARCQKRKIRCDAKLPSCGACVRSGANCTDGGTHRDTPRQYITTLKAHIAWLEAIVKSRCPDVDLNSGPMLNRGDRNLPQPSSLSLDVDGSIEAESRQSVERNTTHMPSQDVFHPEPNDIDNHRDLMQSDIQDHATHSTLDEVSEQIGLVSVTAGTDLRYLGPSSGLFFTRFVLGCMKGRGIERYLDNAPTSRLMATSSLAIPQDLLNGKAEGLPNTQLRAEWISEAYFDSIHLQHPFLHRPSHKEAIDETYRDGLTKNPMKSFHVMMVLAIGATILTRRLKIPLSAEGYCATALKYLDKISFETTLAGVQAMLLLQMYTINNPSSGLNIWSLHYHCVATSLELGLNRNTTITQSNLLNHEIRSRVFWSIYAMDRVLAPLMGRPLASFDDSSRRSLPMDVSDDVLVSSAQERPRMGESPTHISNAIHLFELAKLTSEIVFILYTKDHGHATRIGSPIEECLNWQQGMLERLYQWKNQIPQFRSEEFWISPLCEIKFHDAVTLLLRPSPMFQQPSTESLTECFRNAMDSIRIYESLYRAGILAYSWISMNSLSLSVMTMVYCLWSVPEITVKTDLGDFVKDSRAVSDILSAIGEYWEEARRTRDVLDKVSTATIRLLINRQRGEVRSVDANIGLQTRTHGPVARNTFPSQTGSGGTTSAAIGETITDMTVDFAMESFHPSPANIDLSLFEANTPGLLDYGIQWTSFWADGMAQADIWNEAS